ncbi:MAG: class I SAM-dependent methyltransferase [Deltaproteobacteria bacterium]|nr:class I SAM-dependent methyltransferase [Deltaproteobacteria bacterium]MDQ3299870.1 class I SAM-dependent methyltransferase [Myxococcota bacterium]
MDTLTSREQALVEIGGLLRDEGYRFITVTPETHRRVNARAGAERAANLRDVFGWSRPFDAAMMPAPILAALRRGELCSEHDGLLASHVRFSTLGDGFYVHSAYPTTDENSVFFGPDTYRFCALLRREVATAKRVVDLGCGSGVGGLCLSDRVERIVLADINEVALSFARVNAHLAGVADRVELGLGDLFTNVHGDLDLVIGNPPYLVDPGHRVYRDGGGELGTGLAVRIVREGLARLLEGGRLILYTGAPIVDGEDRFRAAIAPILDSRAARWTYEELDADVFGEELETPAYAAVDRIAAVAACATVA